MYVQRVQSYGHREPFSLHSFNVFNPTFFFPNPSCIKWSKVEKDYLQDLLKDLFI